MVTVAADGTATSTGGTVTAELTAAAQMAYDNQKKAMMAELEGRAAGLHSALTDATGARGEPIRVDANPKNADFAISRGLSGAAMVSDGGKSGWSTRAAPNAVAGYQGTVLDNGKTQTYTVYADIAPAKRKAFLTYYDPGDGNRGASVALKGFTSGVTIDFQDTPSATHGVVTFATAADLAAAANLGLLDPAKFPQPKAQGAGSNTYEYFGTTGKKATSFKGTFHGASGTYACAATDCAVTVTAPSTTAGPVYTAAGSGWTFTPDLKNHPQIVEQDADHMHFGWWIDTPKEAAVGDEFLYDAQVFFGGSMLFNTDATIIALQGTADYAGPAAGLFAVTGDNAAHGEFTATAMLTADFGGTAAGTTVGSEAGSVSGKIGSFVRDDGVANDWELTLGAAGLTATSTGAGSGNIVDGIDQIGGWNFQLYGDSTATGNGANPTGIAGAFNASIDANTAVAGAFATK